VADRQANGGVYRHRDTPTPAAGISVHRIAVVHNAHREDAVLVEAAQVAQRDDRLVSDADHVAQIFLHVDEGDMT